MSTRQPYLYLASQSPRRRELLKQIGVHFELLLHVVKSMSMKPRWQVKPRRCMSSA